MKTLTKVLALITGAVGLIAPAVTPVIGTWISAHPSIAAALGAVATILALFHQPSTTA